MAKPPQDFYCGRNFHTQSKIICYTFVSSVTHTEGTVTLLHLVYCLLQDQTSAIDSIKVFVLEEYLHRVISYIVRLGYLCYYRSLLYNRESYARKKICEIHEFSHPGKIYPSTFLLVSNSTLQNFSPGMQSVLFGKYFSCVGFYLYGMSLR